MEDTPPITNDLYGGHPAADAACPTQPFNAVSMLKSKTALVFDFDFDFNVPTA